MVSTYLFLYGPDAGRNSGGRRIIKKMNGPKTIQLEIGIGVLSDSDPSVPAGR